MLEVVTVTHTQTEPGSRTLTIELEDAATRSWWTSALGLLSARTQMWHFVGLVGGRPAYTSPTFAAPYTWGTLPLGSTVLPRPEWAPGMADALDELRRDVRQDGWVEAGHGAQPWQDVYRHA